MPANTPAPASQADTRKQTPSSNSPPAAPAKTQKQPDKKLTLDQLLADLVADKLVSQDTAEKLVALRRNLRTSELHPLIILADQKWKDPRNPKKLLTLEVLTEWMAGKVGLPYLHIDPFKIDFAAVTKVVSNAYAERFKILPVSVNSTEVVIATCEPYVREWEAELARIMRLEIRRVIANPQDINGFLVEFYNLARSVKSASELHGTALSDITNFEQLVQLGSSGKLNANDQHVVRLVDWLLQYAFDEGASDIHVEPRRDVANVRFRIDGVLHQVYQIPTPVVAAMTSRIKILGRMDVVEKRRPQDGRIKTRTSEGEEIELRLSTMPTAFGEKLVMRIFNPDVIVKDFKELGFSDEDRDRWQKAVTNPHGIVLVTGPTGSGKTTTLYSTLKQLALPDVNVCTIEDPIEMVEPTFNQMQVQAGIGLDFSSGIRTLMRQDPDIVMVGEIRDGETADMAVNASLTGHIVLSTLHTNDAAGALPRLVDMGVEPFLLASSINTLIAQRLVRKICDACTQTVEISAPERKTVEETVASMPKQIRDELKPLKDYKFQKGAGCDKCGKGGYRGRIGIFEVLPMSDGIKELLLGKASGTAIAKRAIEEGMVTMQMDGVLKVLAGITTIEEVMLRTKE